MTSPLFMEGILDYKVFEALSFALEKHYLQARKYTGEPYIVHPMGVAQLLHRHCLQAGIARRRIEPMLCAALLHDTVEDCGVTYLELYDKFGPYIRDLVFWLSDPTKGLSEGKATGTYNRVFRKELAHLFLSRAPLDAKIIKACDILHNAQTIFLNDKGFGPVYLKEVMSLYDIIGPEIEREAPLLAQEWAALPDKCPKEE